MLEDKVNFEGAYPLPQFVDMNRFREKLRYWVGSLEYSGLDPKLGGIITGGGDLVQGLNDEQISVKTGTKSGFEYFGCNFKYNSSNRTERLGIQIVARFNADDPTNPSLTV